MKRKIPKLLLLAAITSLLLAPAMAYGEESEAAILTYQASPAAISVGENISFKVTTTMDTKWIALYEEEGEQLASWEADQYSFPQEDERIWCVMARLSKAGDGQRFVFGASADGEAYEKGSAITINVQDQAYEVTGEGIPAVTNAAPVFKKAIDAYENAFFSVQTADNAQSLELLNESEEVLATWKADENAAYNNNGKSLWYVSMVPETAGMQKLLLRASQDGETYGDVLTTFMNVNEPALTEMPYEPLPGEDFWYSEDSERLDSYEGYELNLILPREIDGYQMTHVGGSLMGRAASGDNYEMELPVRSVVIPETYTDMAYWAFAGCETLETVICYARLDKLEDGMFNGCTSLREVVFVNGLKSIGVNAFSGCDSLETVYLGKYLKELSPDAFAGSSFDAANAITDPAKLPDVDALLAAVKSDPMPTPEPIQAEAIGEEGEPFFGDWTAETMIMGEDTYDVAEMGMNMVITLNPDGTCFMTSDDEVDEQVWTLEDGVAKISGMDDMQLTINEDGKLCMEEMGMVMYLGKGEGAAAEAKPATEPEPTAEPAEEPEPEPEAAEEPEPTAEPEPAAAEEPETTTEPASLTIEERMDKAFVCTSAEVNGMEMDAELLGEEYSMIFHPNGKMEFILAGMELPYSLPYAHQTEEAESFVIDYYGQDLAAVWTDQGFDLNYFDTMLMHFALKEG